MASTVARRLMACAFTSFLFASTALAEDCRLARIATMDFTENGAVVVLAVVNGAKMPMAIDTGAAASTVDPVAAQKLGLPERRMPQDAFIDSKGEAFTYLAVVHDFAVGEMHGNDLKFLVYPSPLTSDGSLGGFLAADVLRHYDVDIDFGARKLNLFSQDHCPGKVVYWANNGVAVLPMHVVNSGHIILPVTLDGHNLDALLDTGSTYSTLSMAFAHNLFGLSADSPEMEKVGTVSGAVQTAMYRHTFKDLNLEGLTINNPVVHLWDNLVEYHATQAPQTGTRLSNLRESHGFTDFILGLSELHRLHLYIAYQEQKLYITPASAPVVAASRGANAMSVAPSADGASH